MTELSTVFSVCLLLFLRTKPSLCSYYYYNGAAARYVVEIEEPFNFFTHRTPYRCYATGADFGKKVDRGLHGNVGCALPTTPINACGNVTMHISNDTSCNNFFAVVPRYDCSFSEKAYHVQMAEPTGFGALIVYNPRGKAVEPMSGAKYRERVKIPTIMVDYECMKALLYRYSYRDGYIVSIKVAPGF